MQYFVIAQLWLFMIINLKDNSMLIVVLSILVENSIVIQQYIVAPITFIFYFTSSAFYYYVNAISVFNFIDARYYCAIDFATKHI